jgi:hypothetical protein
MKCTLQQLDLASLQHYRFCCSTVIPACVMRISVSTIDHFSKFLCAVEYRWLAAMFSDEWQICALLGRRDPSLPEPLS